MLRAVCYIPRRMAQRGNPKTPKGRALARRRSGDDAPRLLPAVARAKAMQEGILPHEWLLKVARGEGIEQHVWEEIRDEDDELVSRKLVKVTLYPDIELRIDAAKAAAPYYAPRLVAQTVGVVGSIDTARLTDEELDARLHALQQRLLK